MNDTIEAFKKMNQHIAALAPSMDNLRNAIEQCINEAFNRHLHTVAAPTATRHSAVSSYPLDGRVVPVEHPLDASVDAPSPASLSAGALVTHRASAGTALGLAVGVSDSRVTVVWTVAPRPSRDERVFYNKSQIVKLQPMTAPSARVFCEEYRDSSKGSVE